MLLKFYTLLLFFSGPTFATAPSVCEHFEKYKSSGINEAALKQALFFYSKNQNLHQLKDDYILIADYSLNSSQKRFYILNLKTGEVQKERVSHGSGKITLYRSTPTNPVDMYVERHNGEKSHDGQFNQCQIPEADLTRINANRAEFNRGPIHSRENITRGGFFKTGSLYVSESHKKENRSPDRFHWYPLKDDFNGVRLHGLTPKVNDQAFAHGVVLHEASYNHKHAPIMGRSYGCPAFEKGVLKKHFDSIIEGRLYFSYVPQCKEDTALIEDQIPGFKDLCAPVNS